MTTTAVLTRDQLTDGIVAMMDSIYGATDGTGLRAHLARRSDEELLADYQRWTARIQKKAEAMADSKAWQADRNAKLAADYPPPAAPVKADGWEDADGWHSNQAADRVALVKFHPDD